MLTSRPTTRPALTRAALSPAERASHSAPITEKKRIGSALRIAIGESVRCRATAAAGITMLVPSSIASPSAKVLPRARPAKSRPGSTRRAIGAPSSTSWPVVRTRSAAENTSTPPAASRLLVIQSTGLPSSSRLKAAHSAMTYAVGEAKPTVVPSISVPSAPRRASTTPMSTALMTNQMRLL
ncbi:unannotated protein [freshwater metagenome]|uniref:Unannotated protein n=1 Tax=freshwater metagenome TaxID=449393 RepID=A0A6J6PMP4_9ZZZZ